LFILVLYGASLLVQWATWRWLKWAAPRWVERYRRPLLAVFGALFVMPLAREFAFFYPSLFAWPLLAAAGMLWHVTLWIGMAAIGVGYAVKRLVRRLRRHTRPPVKTTDHASTDHSSMNRRDALERIGGAMAFAASGAVLGWGAFRGRFEWAIEEVPIRLARLPKALDGFTIVQISDLHVGAFIGERELDMGLGLVERIRADLIVITGDIVDTDARYIPLAARRLSAFRPREGIACIPGNHEYYVGASAVLDAMRGAGIDVLVNRGKVVAPADGGIALLGVDDLWTRDNRRGPGPDLSLARSMVPPDLATILLAHQPRFAPVASRAGIDLQLSGHTHGGQINPGFRPIDLFYRYVAGRYDVGAMQLYVNRGFGTVGPPTRVGAPPEITKIVLVAG
jgi:predicted MPP superfamily phosphohydrolase